MKYKLGDKATLSIIDKSTGEVIATQEIQTSDFKWSSENGEIYVKPDIDPKN